MYVQCGRNTEAIAVWEDICKQGIALDYYTYTSALTACANLVSIQQGEAIYQHFCRSGLEQHTIFVNTALLNLYANTGSVDTAAEIFGKIIDNAKLRNEQLTVIPYNSML
jgi:hypothetical protein